MSGTSCSQRLASFQLAEAIGRSDRRGRQGIHGVATSRGHPTNMAVGLNLRSHACHDDALDRFEIV